MKRIHSVFLCALCVLALALPASAASAAAYTISVNGTAVSTDRLPSGAYLQGDAVMVPLRLIGEQLGYQVTWDKASREAVMEDSIQKVALRSGSDAAVFTGKLQVIDLTRDVTLSSPAVIRGGTTYVPLTLFNEFFNETAVTGAQITVTTMTEELQTAPRG